MELPMQVVVAVVVAVIVLAVIIVLALMVREEGELTLQSLFDIPSFIDCLIRRTQDPNVVCGKQPTTPSG